MKQILLETLRTRKRLSIVSMGLKVSILDQPYFLSSKVSKVSDAVSHNIPIGKVMKYRQGKWMTRLSENWVNSRV